MIEGLSQIGLLLKGATEGLKAFGEIKDSTQKLRYADTMSMLADARIALAEASEIVAEKDRRIAELEDALKTKETLIRNRDAYYKIVDGKPTGYPFCSRCWEVESMLVHLCDKRSDRGILAACPKCKTEYTPRTVMALNVVETDA